MLVIKEPTYEVCSKCGRPIEENDHFHCPLCHNDLRQNYVTKDGPYFCFCSGDDNTSFFERYSLVWVCPGCGYSREAKNK